MATRIPGSGGTNQANTLEAGLIGDIRRLQAYERDTTKNPSSFNNVQSGSEDDSSSFTASVNFPITLSTNNGVVSITPIDYLNLSSSDYSPGTGGTIKAPNIQGAIIEQTILMSNLEKNASKNPGGAVYINFSITNTITSSSGNANFTASYSAMPLESTQSSDGSQTTKGKSYLLD